MSQIKSVTSQEAHRRKAAKPEETMDNQSEASQETISSQITTREPTLAETFICRFIAMMFIVEIKILIWGWSTTGLPPQWTFGYNESWLLKIINETHGLLVLVCAVPNKGMRVPTNMLFPCECFFTTALFVVCLGLPVAIAAITVAFHS